MERLSMNTPTQRTDAAMLPCYELYDNEPNTLIVTATFARALERELVGAKSKLELFEVQVQVQLVLSNEKDKKLDAWRKCAEELANTLSGISPHKTNEIEALSHFTTLTKGDTK